MNTYICRYCRQPSDPGSPTCPMCGAPVDIRSVVSDSGWVEQPPIRDMARLQFGQSHVPDRRHHRPGRGVQPRTGGLDLLLPPRAALDRAADPAGQHADERRVEPEDGGAAADHGGGPRPRPPRAVRQPRGRDRGAADAARPADLGPRAPVPVRHRQHQVRLVPVGRLVRDRPGLRRPRDALPDGAVRRRVRRAGRPPACCCCTRRATPSSATSGRARPCWSSRARCCTAT